MAHKELSDADKLLLISEGLSDCIDVLASAGLLRVADIAENGISESDLEKIGVAKLFHRKKLLRISTEAWQRHCVENGTNASWVGPSPSNARSSEPHKDTSPASAATPSPPPKPQPRSPPRIQPIAVPIEKMEAPTRKEGGDRVLVEVIAARGAVGQLSEREHYVKVSLCEMHGSEVHPIEATVQRTGTARGPYPTFMPEYTEVRSLEKRALSVPTSFATECISFELKEKHLLSANKHVGIAVFPVAFFHRFTSSTVVDEWHPMRLKSESDDGAITAMIRLRFRVPGGCPQQLRKAFHVAAVNMTGRKLRVSVFEATVYPYARASNGTDELEEVFSSPPSTFVVLKVDKGEAKNSRQTTKTVIDSFCPSFDSVFEYFTEVSSAKLLTAKLKHSTTFGAETVGAAMIPIQYYLSLKEVTDIDEAFPLLDLKNRERGRVHLRIEVRLCRMDEVKCRVQFARTDSIPRAGEESQELAALRMRLSFNTSTGSPNMSPRPAPSQLESSPGNPPLVGPHKFDIRTVTTTTNSDSDADSLEIEVPPPSQQVQPPCAPSRSPLGAILVDEFEHMNPPCVSPPLLPSKEHDASPAAPAAASATESTRRSDTPDSVDVEEAVAAAAAPLGRADSIL